MFHALLFFCLTLYSGCKCHFHTAMPIFRPKNIVTHRKHCKIMPGSQSANLIAPAINAAIHGSQVKAGKATTWPLLMAKCRRGIISVRASSSAGCKLQGRFKSKQNNHDKCLHVLYLSLLHKAGQSQDPESRTQKPRSRTNKSLWSWAIGIWPRVLAFKLLLPGRGKKKR